jgi:hypothetical protein
MPIHNRRVTAPAPDPRLVMVPRVWHRYILNESTLNFVAFKKDSSTNKTQTGRKMTTDELVSCWNCVIYWRQKIHQKK